MPARRYRLPHLAAALLLALLAAFVGKAQAEELVSLISDEVVSIDTAFDGAMLTFAGEIGPGHGADANAPIGPYHVVMVVRGPGEDRTVWGAEQRLGVWLNTRQATFTDVPGLYWILSSGRLGDIVSTETPSFAQLTAVPPFAEAMAISVEHEALAPELRRLMNNTGLYGVNEQGIVFRSDRFYTARLSIPTTAPTGLYLARTYVLKDGIVVARNSQSFSVRVVGFERLLAVTAQSQPLLYGLACVALALFTGWLGGVVFKR